MALVNLLINGLPIYSVKWLIRRLIPYQPPADMVPVTDIQNIASPRSSGSRLVSPTPSHARPRQIGA